MKAIDRKPVAVHSGCGTQTGSVNSPAAREMGVEMFLDRDDVRAALQDWVDGASGGQRSIAASSAPDINTFLLEKGIADAADHSITVEAISFASSHERDEAQRSRAGEKCRLVCKRMDPPECFWVCL